MEPHLRLVLATLIASALGVACKNEPATGSGAGSATAGAASSAKPPASSTLAGVLPTSAPAAFRAWDLPARAKAWQGAWVIEQSLAFPLALEVNGATATTWNGKAEKHLTFALESPCSATFTEHAADGSSSGTVTHFTVAGGKLIAGLGDAGSRHGKTAVACISNQVLTLDASGTCLAWRSMFDGWTSKPATCGFAQKDGKEVFTATVNGVDSTLQIHGDALLSDQLAHQPATPSPTFAAAKAARDAAPH